MRRALGMSLWVAMVSAGLAVFLFLPHFVSDFHSRDLAQAGAFFIAIIGLDLLTGYTGQISLGHGALMAIGGYTTAALIVHEHWRDVWTIPLAGIAAGIVGFVVGLPALRLSGLYLALATFALAVAMPSLIKKFSGLTGGSQGLQFLESSPSQVTGLSGKVTVFGHTMTQNHFLYYLTWSIGIVGLGVAWLVVRGRGGRTFRSVRDSEIAAVSSGVNLAWTKTFAFALSGVYAGVAGALYAIQNEIVNPPSFDLEPAPRRRGRRRPRLAVRPRARRPVRRVPADPLDQRLDPRRSARFHLRRGHHRRDDPAADRGRRAASAAGKTPNNLVVHSSLDRAWEGASTPPPLRLAHWPSRPALRAPARPRPA